MPEEPGTKVGVELLLGTGYPDGGGYCDGGGTAMDAFVEPVCAEGVAVAGPTGTGCIELLLRLLMERLDEERAVVPLEDPVASVDSAVKDRTSVALSEPVYPDRAEERDVTATLLEEVDTAISTTVEVRVSEEVLLLAAYSEDERYATLLEVHEEVDVVSVKSGTGRTLDVLSKMDVEDVVDESLASIHQQT